MKQRIADLISLPPRKRPVNTPTAKRIRTLPWIVYILECADHTLYTGITNNLHARLIKHSSGTGARYTRSHPPTYLVYTEKCKGKGTALRRERTIKQLSRAQKLDLIGGIQTRRKK